ncbi:phage repressor protein/antirepressor Ant [Pasteurellaceae bacterium 20609_3]|uniref:BRO-N domain-containing protein n=1 Tax=Spirabiliibacterium mucosae TaxID=28156 RepID=UPI001AAD739A|nr:Bro-N domain-containing protein [Spirabiliibacterium mucosae]MBE2898075.1 phage repressor protein/antirepressor Ant [Spirabiliibacterium mucosae]
MTNQTQLQTFNFKSNIVRAELINEQPHFCLKDVCDVFGIKNSRDLAAKVLDPKGVDSIYTLTNGGKQELTFINEPNLYRIIFKSRKAEAVEFQNWVFNEVLPQIRKTGKYEKTQTTVDDRTGLRNAVNMLVSKKGLIYSDAYNLVHQYMNVESIEDIDKDDLPKAVAYCHKIILEGELIDKSEPKQVLLTPDQEKHLINMWLAITRLNESVYHTLRIFKLVETRQLRSLQFNYNVCERYIKSSLPFFRELVDKNKPNKLEKPTYV